MKFISLFSGIGGFDLGFERAGMTCVAQVEMDKHASGVLARHFPNVQRFEDVRDVGRHNLPSADVICGGFPCQDVSVAGNRAGLAGKRSGLWHEFHRIIGELTPRLVVIENVPGLLSSNNGLDFAIVLQGLVEHGYSVVWRVLDAQHFGLAQRRKRVFIVGSLGNGTAAEILLESYSGKGHSSARREAGEGLAATVSASAPSRRNGGSNPTAGQFVAKTLKGEGNWKADGSDNFVIGTLAASGAGSARPAGQANETDMLVVAWGIGSKASSADAVTSNQSHASGGPSGMGIQEELAHTLKAGRVGQVATAAFNVTFSDSNGTRPDRPNGGLYVNETEQANTLHAGAAREQTLIAFQQNQREEVRILGEQAGSLTAESGMHNQNFIASSGVRRLTPMECERLQGFPDGWTDGQADTQRYKQLGNAVAVNVAEWIGRRMFAALEGVGLDTEGGRNDG